MGISKDQAIFSKGSREDLSWQYNPNNQQPQARPTTLFRLSRLLLSSVSLGS
jgi:hypothetical protein